MISFFSFLELLIHNRCVGLFFSARLSWSQTSRYLTVFSPKLFIAAAGQPVEWSISLFSTPYLSIYVCGSSIQVELASIHISKYQNELSDIVKILVRYLVFMASQTRVDASICLMKMAGQFPYRDAKKSKWYDLQVSVFRLVFIAIISIACSDVDIATCNQKRNSIRWALLLWIQIRAVISTRPILWITSGPRLFCRRFSLGKGRHCLIKRRNWYYFVSSNQFTFIIKSSNKTDKKKTDIHTVCKTVLASMILWIMKTKRSAHD